jgi:heat shock protein HtpX
MPPLSPAALARHRRRNRRDSTVILAGIGGLMALAGWLVAGPEGILWSVLATSLALLLQPGRSTALLRALWGAERLSPLQAPGLYRMLAELAERAGLERVPPLYYLRRPEVVALSTGWGRDAAVMVSDGLLRVMPPRELAAVLAHEVSHLRHGDLKILRLADAAGQLTRLLSLFGLVLVVFYLPSAVAMGLDLPLLGVLLLVVTPVASDLMTLKLSRTREFAADAGAAELTGDPHALMTALDRLGGGWERMGSPRRFLSLIRTHPTTAERLARLAELAPAPEPRRLIPPEVLLVRGLLTGRRW